MSPAGSRPPLLELVIERRSWTGRWGRLDVPSPQEATLTGPTLDVALHVYPPGTTTGQRRLIGLRASFLLYRAGFVVAVLAGAAILANFGWFGVPIYLTALTTGWIALSRATRSVRNGVKTVWFPTRDGKTFVELAEALDRLDETPEQEPVGYELEWGHIYNGLPEEPHYQGQALRDRVPEAGSTLIKLPWPMTGREAVGYTAFVLASIAVQIAVVLWVTFELIEPSLWRLAPVPIWVFALHRWIGPALVRSIQPDDLAARRAAFKQRH